MLIGHGQAPRKLFQVGGDQYLSFASWSPDSRWMAYVRQWKTTRGSWSSALEVRPAGGGPAKTLVGESGLPKSSRFASSLKSQIWLSDWRLVFSVEQASKPSSPPAKIQPVGRPGKGPHRGTGRQS
jgi:hypothetical protein